MQVRGNFEIAHGKEIYIGHACTDVTYRGKHFRHAFTGVIQGRSPWTEETEDGKNLLVGATARTMIHRLQVTKRRSRIEYAGMWNAELRGAPHPM